VTTAESGWSPTLRTPRGGVPAWTEPDPTAAGAPRLDAGIELMIIERRDDGWARVRCENGWETWVDERVLLPLDGPPTPSTGRGLLANRRLWLIVGAAALVAVVAIAVVTLSSGSDDEDSDLFVAETELTPALDAPAGWRTSADGRTVARDAADLDADVVTGPRARLLIDHPPPEPAAYGPALATDRIVSTTEPSSFLVGSREGVIVTLIERTSDDPNSARIARTYISVGYAPGQAALFVLETPGADLGATPTLLRIPTLR
jgi:hypothetical protein